MINHTLFISDLHLEPNQPEITRLFFNFLELYAPKADAIYILGDFFEAWIGDDDKSDFITAIQQALKKFTATDIPIYFMRGNRDFLIGEVFAKATGVKLIADPTLINLYGKPVLLMHGDSLCTQDIKHLRFRKYAHNPALNRYFLKLPLFIRHWLAKRIRKASKKHTQNTRYFIMDVTPTEVEKMLRLHNCQQLIHGHTHQPNIHNLIYDSQTAVRIVLGAWHNNEGNMLIYYADGGYKYENINLVN